MARRSDDELLDARRDIAATVDRPLTSAEYQQRHRPDQPGASTISTRFRSWAAPLRAAGLPLTKTYKQ